MPRARRLMGWLSPPRAHGRQRRLLLDPLRLGLAATSLLAAALALASTWAWREYRLAAQAGADQALVFLDRRLGAINQELAVLARHSGLPQPALACPAPLVEQLLQHSLQSSLVRQFELLQVGSTLRCGPQGERNGPALGEVPVRGLSIVPGSALTTRPIVLRPVGPSAALQATLDPYALAVPRAELSNDLRSTPMRIVAFSPQAGSVPIWDSRPNPGQTPPVFVAEARSSHHHVGARAQIDDGDLWATMRLHGLVALGAMLPLLALGASWIWESALRRSRLSHRLQQALRKRRFVPFVQPIVDLQTGQCIGGEVLMRWNHPQRGILAPVEFIGEAERTGLILGMSDLTMALAAHQLAPLAQAHPSLYFSFNITPAQLRDPGFAQTLAQTFGPDTLPRSQVMLELTERDIVDPAARRVLTALRADGWRIAIDDFGTGQSSLAMLETMVIDRLKIDRAFVSTVGEQTANRPVLDAIIGLARDLGVPLIAEGVETPAQRDYLVARGVTHAQGYLMAKPMPTTAYLAWFAARQSAEAAAARSPHLPQPPEAPLPLTETQRALRQRLGSADGPLVRDRWHHGKRYRNCFVGAQAVDWIVREQGVGRADAVRLGRGLLAVGLIEHVVDEHDFEDGPFFYRLASPAAQHSGTCDHALAAVQQGLLRDGGFPWRDHCRGMVRHRHCGTGRGIVDWIVAHQGASRATATQWAAAMMAQGALRHVFDDRPFRDDRRQLYRPA